MQAITPDVFMSIARSGLAVSNGPEVDDPNRETTNSVLRCGAELLTDGNLDTRNSAKSIFRLLSPHPQFQSVIVDQCLVKLYRGTPDKLEQLKKAISQKK